jgi:hypothetical protein
MRNKRKTSRGREREKGREKEGERERAFLVRDKNNRR